MPFVVSQQQTHIFPEVQAAQRCPEVTRTAGCIVTDFKCEEEEPSSPITSVRWKAPKAASHPAGHSSAVIRSVWQEWQVLDLLPLSPPPFFSLCFFLTLLLCVTASPQADHSRPQPLGCCQGANSPSAQQYACICYLFFPSIFNKYNGGRLVVELISLVCSLACCATLLPRSRSQVSGWFMSDLMPKVRERRDGIAQ